VGNGEVWSFGSKNGLPTPTPGDNDYAYLVAYNYGTGDHQDTSLVSPVVDLSAVDSPELSFDAEYLPDNDVIARADLSVDGGKTWTNVWSPPAIKINGHVNIPIPQAARQSAVQVRFRYAGSDFLGALAVDNVLVGVQECVPTVAGGITAGFVLDHNTGAGIDGATVTQAATGETTVTSATPDDPSRSAGFYWMFSAPIASTSLSATAPRYTSGSGPSAVLANSVTRRDLVLQAGRLSANVSKLGKSATLGQQPQTAEVQLSNTGTEPLRVSLGSQDSMFTSADGQPQIPPAAQVAPSVAPSRAAPQIMTRANRSTTATDQPPGADQAWSSLPNYPTPVQDNAVTEGDGKVWSVGGYDGGDDTVKSYVFDPQAHAWTPIADAPTALAQAKAAWLDGQLYLIGGWQGINPSSAMYVYNPATNSWREVAHLPLAVSAQGVAVLGGKVYVVGGCTTSYCDPGTNVAAAYDPGSNTWSRIADYPVAAAFGACDGVAGQLICAGGENSGQVLANTYRYDPAHNTWTAGADLPAGGVWAMSTTGANGRLQIIDGLVPSGDLTNQVLEYDPASNNWIGLPPTSQPLFRGGAACGIYQVGGVLSDETTVATDSVLPGYSGCGDEVSWLSEDTPELTLAPGAHASVAVTLDSSSLAQPGTYTATLIGATDSPYPPLALPVTLNLNPPSTWGKISGTVTDASSGGSLAGVTVQINTLGGKGTAAYTLSTDRSGRYELWLDRGGTRFRSSWRKTATRLRRRQSS
jgi:hypothetical protein